MALVTFGIVAHHLSAAEIGVYGVVSLLTGLAEILVTASFADALQQKRDLRPDHVNATFWVALGLGLMVAVAISLGAAPVAHAYQSPQTGPMLLWASLIVPMSAVTCVPAALLRREMKFGQTSRIGVAATLVGGIVTITALLVGAGLWSLLLAEFAARSVRLICLWKASGFRPGSPQRLRSITELMRFNLSTLGTNLLGYADSTAPRLLTGIILGPAALGYLMVAQRVLDLLSQLVLAPLGNVAMVSAARVQDDAVELRRLVISLYRLSSACAYPVFLGAALMLPDLAVLVGGKWLPAVATARVLLLVGLRTSTGMFNIPILRGVGHCTGPLILLGAGLALNLLLVPVGAHFGPSGVAAAVLGRTLLTWPLGCVLIKRITKIGIREQLGAGSGSFLAASVMILSTAILMTLVPSQFPALRLVLGCPFGCAVYLVTLSCQNRALTADVLSRLKDMATRQTARFAKT